MKTLNQIGIWLLFFAIIGCGVGQAQDDFSSFNLSGLSDNGVLELSGTNISSFQTFSDDELNALVDVLDATPTVGTPTLPNGNAVGGTFWSLQNPGMPPLPADVNGVDAWPMEDGSFLLDDLNFDYSGGGGMHAMDDGSPFLPGAGGDDGGTNYYEPTNSYVLPDYGTNLWIAQWNVATNLATGIASNTIADISYEMLWATNLTQTNWTSLGFILGSEITNWTALIPQTVIPTNNGFLRLRSWESSDGSGLPDWWELEYFGSNGIDPNALDSAGDGYTIYQKYLMGLNPNIFYTPTAPQSLTAVYNANNDTTLLNWVSVLGPVSGYTVQAADVFGNTVDYTIPASSNSFNDTNTLGDYIETLSVEANYTAGNSGWSSISVLAAALPYAGLINGADGYINIVLYDPPADLSVLRVYRYSQQSEFDPGWYWPDAGFGSDYPADLADGYFDIPAANITNGIVAIPAAQAFSFGTYDFAIQIFQSNGVSSAQNDLGVAANDVFVDGRAQLKDNLRFRLRAATDNGPFEVYQTLEPTNYVYAGFYNDLAEFRPLQPFADNNTFRNFVFDANNLLTTSSNLGSLLSPIETYAGMPNTGVNYQSRYDEITYPEGYYIVDTDIGLSSAPDWNADFSAIITTNGLPSAPPSVLTSSLSEWILPAFDTLNYYWLSPDYTNYYGLAMQSQLAVEYENNQFTFIPQTPGTVETNTPMVYFDFNEPIFQTDSYYFARPGTDPLPEQGAYSRSAFSPTNTTPPLMLVAVGNSLAVAGYAKLAITNGYSGFYGYLGQYFAQAYQVDTKAVSINNIYN